MSTYTYMAKHYDQWMDQEAYHAWVRWILMQLAKSELKGPKVLELCSGTGRVTLALAEKGYSVWAVDQSEEMLAVAQQKSENMLNRIRWIQGDMLELQLRERFDAVLCINDGVNYLKSEEELIDFLKVCHYHLKPGGLLLFDFSSPYKLQYVLGEQTIAEAHEDNAFIWENHYDEETQTLEFNFHIFERQSNGTYARFIEHHQQRSFMREQIQDSVKGLFQIVESVGDDYEKQSETDQRFYYVMRKEMQ